MNDQDIPVKEQAQPGVEEPSTPPEERTPDEPPQQATPPPFVPYTQAPYTWPAYAPVTGQQWGSGEPYASPYYRHRRSHWPWVVLIVILLVVFVSGGAWFLAGSLGYHPGSTSTTTQQCTVGANPTIALTNDTCSIHVRASASSGDVTIQATKHTNWWGNANDVNVTYHQDREGNTITVNVERLGNSNIFGSSSVDFDLTVPGTATLQLKTNTGSIDVSGVSGQLVLTSNTGSVEASGSRLSTNSQLLTDTGSVTFSGAISQTGIYQFQTNTGSINTNFPGVVVEHRQFTGADAHSDVGSAPQATLALRTNTGSINLYQG